MMRSTPTRPSPDPINRRVFLRRAGGAAIGVSLLASAGCESLGVEPATDGLTFLPYLTSNDTFFEQFGGDAGVANWPGILQIARDTWSMTIDGTVATERTFRYDDIIARQQHAVTILATLRCVLDNNAGQGLVGTATWTGIPLRIFLEDAGIDRSQTRRLRIHGADGFTNNLPLDRIFTPPTDDLVEPLLVYAMNGEPLTASHGAPLRLLVPGHYGYKSVKWVTRLEASASDEVFGTYQEVLGYADDGRVDVSSKTTSLLRGARLQAGRTRIAGFAMSGFGRVETVNVRIDADEPRPARILTLNELVAAAPRIRGVQQLAETERFPYPYRGVWTLWEYLWDATPGPHTILIQATDTAGRTQPLDDPDPTDGQNPAFRFEVTVQ